MSSREYIKRIWRVPKHRGAPEYLATLVVKSLVKHGWPAGFRVLAEYDGFQILFHKADDHFPADFLSACEIAVRIAARTYRLDVTEHFGCVVFQKAYEVALGGHFKEVKL